MEPETLLYEGYLYTIREDKSLPAGLFIAYRNEDQPKRNGTYRWVKGCAADLATMADGTRYLPNRIRPLLVPRLQAAVTAGTLTPGSAESMRQAIQSHPQWALGRDDLAEQAIATAYGVTLPNDIPEAFVVPSLL